MASRGITFGRTFTSSALVFMILLQTILVCDQSSASPLPTPAKKNDIIAGSEFLSVFINGASMARPPRRRISLRKPGSSIAVTPSDAVSAEAKNDEANIYRISRVPMTIKPTPARPRTTLVRDDGVRYYPISHKILENRHHNLDAIVDDLGRPGDISPKYLLKTPGNPVRKPINIKQVVPGAKVQIKPAVNLQKVIGVSVTSSVEATPYRVRVEHHDPNDVSLVTNPPPVIGTTVSTSSPESSSPLLSTDVTSPPAKLVTEELSNIVSESNRSEFSVDEGRPQTSQQDRNFVTPKPVARHHTLPVDNAHDTRDSAASSSNSEPVEQRYEFQVPNSEMKEVNQEFPEVHQPFLRNQGRKVGRHFEDSSYNQPTKIYNTRQNGKPFEHKIFGNSPKVYSEPAKIYGEPEKVYGKPSKVYGQPSQVYSEPAKVYGEPSKVYGEPSKVYGEPAKVYSEPAKVYGEPSKVYDQATGQAVGEPEEKNYEVDEAVSVGSNGNVHGPQTLTESSANIDEDGHKIGYIVEGRNYRKYRVEERTPDGFIVGEYGVVSHDDGSLRGVRYTADGTINPRLIYDALMKFLSL